jgi:lipopolysaccharide export system protein LptA
MKKTAGIAGFLLLITLAYGESKPISFTADRMSGSAGKKNAVTVLEGNAVVIVGSLHISGARIELSGKDFRNVTATGNVIGSDDEKGFSFTASELTYDREREVATFKGNAKLSDSKNAVEASAAVISYNQKTETAFFQVGVKLTRKNIKCSSGVALYRRTLSLLDLSGSPVVNRDGDEFRADRIGVNLDTENITLDGAVSGSLKDSAKEDAPKDVPSDSPDSSEVIPSDDPKNVPAGEDAAPSDAPAKENAKSE